MCCYHVKRTVTLSVLVIELIWLLHGEGELINKYQTLITGFFAIIAAFIAFQAIMTQIQSQERIEQKKYTQNQLSVLRAFLADIKAIIVGCNECIDSKVDGAVAQASQVNARVGHIQILVPFSSQFYVELSKSNGILQPEIAEEISIFYNALPVYERVMKQQFLATELQNPQNVQGLKAIVLDLKGRAEKLRDALNVEIPEISKLLCNEQPRQNFEGKNSDK